MGAGVIFLDRQHAGRPGRRGQDRGAAADIDGSGVIEHDEREANLTPVYLRSAELRLLEYGHTVIPVSDGSYRERAARINAYASEYPPGTPMCAIAAHINAGLGSYGICFHDHRSRTGPELAARIAHELRQIAPELSDVRILSCGPSDWTRNAYACIKWIGSPIAICFEPFFIDNPAHSGLTQPHGLQAIGHALADGINRWTSSR